MLMANKTHVFYSPHKIVFGAGTASGIGAEVKSLGASKVFIVTDPGVTKAGLLKPVTRSLEEAKIAYVVFDQVQAEPPVRLVDEGVDRFRSEGCDLVLGVGGGSSLDVAKGVSIVAGNGGRILDYAGMDLVTKPGAPKILMPTTAGTGAEITRVLVVTDEAENTKKVVYSFYCLPELAIVDPLLTYSMPPSVTADTGMDALVHAVETFVSVHATPFSDILAEKAIGWIGRYLPIAWSKGSNPEARHHMSLAATLSGLAFASGGLGAVHGLSYVLGTRYHMPHGRSNAIMLPHVMKFNLPGAPEKYAAIAALLGRSTAACDVNQAAALAVEAVEDLLKTLKISCRLRDYGISEKELPFLVEGGLKQSRLFSFNPRDLSEEDVRAIYQAAL
jgi:alcohol dehydrogenase class IV